MNERIKELAANAKFMAEETINCKISANDELYVFAEKFAELIVKECTTVCLMQRDPQNLNYKPSERFAEAIKGHFGVK